MGDAREVQRVLKGEVPVGFHAQDVGFAAFENVNHLGVVHGVSERGFLAVRMQGDGRLAAQGRHAGRAVVSGARGEL